MENSESAKILALLCNKWPRAFSNPIPLAIGIRREIWKLIREDGVVQKHQLKAFFKWYCHQPNYRALIANGGARYGLDGEVKGEISCAHQQSALEIIEKVKNSNTH